MDASNSRESLIVSGCSGHEITFQCDDFSEVVQIFQTVKGGLAERVEVKPSSSMAEEGHTITFSTMWWVETVEILQEIAGSLGGELNKKISGQDRVDRAG